VKIGIYFKGNSNSENFPEWVQPLHINIKELYALDRSIELFAKELKDQTISWRVDNNSALAVIKKGWFHQKLGVKLISC